MKSRFSLDSRSETFCFSAGKIGYQVEMSPDTLAKMIRYSLADLTEE